MKKKVYNIYVSKKDIIAARGPGHEQRGSTCPVARAAKRHLKIEHMHVGRHWATFKGIDVALPPAVTKFIMKFDDRQSVEPFSFRVRF